MSCKCGEICPKSLSLVTFDGEGVLRNEVARRLQVSPKTVSQLIRSGVLATQTDRHPLTRMPLSTVRCDSLAAFEAKYVALSRAADALGTTFQALVCTIAKLEMETLDRSASQTRILRRKGLDRISQFLRQWCLSIGRLAVQSLHLVHLSRNDHVSGLPPLRCTPSAPVADRFETGSFAQLTRSGSLSQGRTDEPVPGR